MVLKTMSQIVREYVKEHPGSTNAEIAKALKLGIKDVATRTSYEVKQGRMQAEGTGQFVMNREVHKLYLLGEPRGRRSRRAPAKPKAPLAVPPPPARPDLNAFISGFASSLADTIAGMVADRLKDVLPEKVQAAIPQPPHPPAQKQEVVKDSMKRIAVIGLLPIQNAEIQQEFGDTFSIQYIDASEIKRAKVAALQCDRVFLHTRHVGHAMDEALQSAGARLVRVKGALSSMRDALTEYYVNEVSK